MNTTPKGKIGRLPKALREHVNRRMENGQKEISIAAWLNGLPEVQTMLAAEFKSKPISQQNLSLWRKHGYKSWSMRREAQDMAAEIGDLPCPADLPVTDHVATWASVHYLMTVRELVENNEGQSHLKVLRELLRDVIALRRSEQSNTRLSMQLKRLERAGSGSPPGLT